jgi:hypothetical protein
VLRPDVATLAWHGFCFTLPRGWEAVAYSLAARRGEFRFQERLADRGQLTWLHTAGTPDVEALVRDLASRQDGTKATVHVLKQGPWLIAHAANGQPFHAMTWIVHDRRLLHWRFPVWTGEATAQPWRTLLESFSAEPGDTVRWALFGTSDLLPRRFAPVGVDARPGAVRIDYADRADVRITARRFGLARALLAEHRLSTWLQRILRTDRARLEHLQEAERDGQQAVRAAFTMIGRRPLERIFRQRWPGEAWWWHDAVANRMLAIEQVGPRGAPRVEFGLGF